MIALDASGDVVATDGRVHSELLDLLGGLPI
jgi:hypothetical protein